MDFQIKQNCGQGCGSWSYITIEGNPSEAEIKKAAVDKVNEEWKRDNELRLSFAPPKPAAPTIYISEYDSAKNQKVKNGINLKARWR